MFVKAFAAAALACLLSAPATFAQSTDLPDFYIAVDDTFDASYWTYTTSTDSIFRFPVAEIGPMEHLFLIRAVDNLGKQDPTPDTLRFEAFTAAPPTVDLVQIIGDMPTLGRRESLGAELPVEAVGQDLQSRELLGQAAEG